MSNINNSWKNKVIINKIKVKGRWELGVVVVVIRATLLPSLPLTSTLIQSLPL